MIELLRAARPWQWTKNLVCFAALMFAGRLGDAASVRAASLTFLCFCLASSAVYIWNDIRDREEDRRHPKKSARPLAAGRLSVRAGAIEASALLLGAAGIVWSLVPAIGGLLAAFVGLNLVYSGGGKAVPVLDLVLVALGFVLRVEAGVEALAAPESAWILLCMFFLALFLACGKRRGEIAQLTRQAVNPSRQVLGAYSVSFLDHLLGVSGTTALVCYSLYAVTVQSDSSFVVTILPVVFGIGRYLMLVLVRGEGDDPAELLVNDPPLVAAAVVWAGLSVLVVYFHLHLLPDRGAGGR